jgi:hypothetical protein
MGYILRYYINQIEISKFRDIVNIEDGCEGVELQT